jgi:putative ubiquitin-RnfH superfamily antitoxin RatB of RatAB toxin-antitoxin module
VTGGARVVVEVVHAAPGVATMRRLVLEPGATVADAIAAAGMERLLTEGGVGVWGRRVGMDFVLRDGDRVELYRPLIADPKEGRRRRAGGASGGDLA